MLPLLISSCKLWFGIQKQMKLTFRIKESWLLAAVKDFLLALLGPCYDGSKLLGWGAAVVERRDVRLVERRALDGDRSRAAVRQHRPHFLLCQEKKNTSVSALQTLLVSLMPQWLKKT